MKMSERFLSSLMALLIGVFANVNVLEATKYSKHTPHKTTNNEKNNEIKHPTIAESWKKLISLKWRKLSGDDAWNIIAPVVVVVGACVVLSNNGNQTPRAYNQATPQQQQMAQARQELYNRLSQPYQMPSFEQYKQEGMRNYNENIIPGIMNQFAGTGVGQRSSAFEQQLRSAGTGLEVRLAAQYETECQRVNAMNLERLKMLVQYFPNGL